MKPFYYLCDFPERKNAVSLGPDMKDIHTSEEVLSIASTERVWNYLVQVLKNLKD